MSKTQTNYINLKLKYKRVKYKHIYICQYAFKNIILVMKVFLVSVSLAARITLL